MIRCIFHDYDDFAAKRAGMRPEIASQNLLDRSQPSALAGALGCRMPGAPVVPQDYINKIEWVGLRGDKGCLRVLGCADPTMFFRSFFRKEKELQQAATHSNYFHSAPSHQYIIA